MYTQHNGQPNSNSGQPTPLRRGTAGDLVLAVSARAISPRTQEIEDGKEISLETCKVDVWRENY